MFLVLDQNQYLKQSTKLKILVHIKQSFWFLHFYHFNLLIYHLIQLCPVLSHAIYKMCVRSYFLWQLSRQPSTLLITYVWREQWRQRHLFSDHHCVLLFLFSFFDTNGAKCTLLLLLVLPFYAVASSFHSLFSIFFLLASPSSF